MGLLEKAESGKTPEEKTKKVVAEKTPKNKPAKVEKPKKESRMSLRSSRRRERKERKAKAEPTELPSFPDGFEPPTSGQTAFRRLVDVIVCYGWLVPVVALTGYGTNFSPTIYIIGGTLLYILNLGFLPSRFSRTIGNIVSRTKYVTSKGNNASWAYTFLKGLNLPLVLLGLASILTIASDLSLGDNTTSTIFRIIGLLMIVPPMLDYILTRFSMAKRGLWERIFGGVWLVRSTRTGSTKGWLKRLDQLSDYAEKRGLLSEREEDTVNLD